MKRTIQLLLGCFISLTLSAQTQADAYIKEAQDFIAQKEYKQAQLSLQDAVNELNRLIAQQVGESLPGEINGLKADGEAEVETAGMGMLGGGVQISRSYTHPSNDQNTAQVQIITNSPMLASLGMYITNPGMMGNEYKGVRIGTTRAILRSESSDDGNGHTLRDSELQIPLSQTLLTLQLRGFATEQDEINFATKLDLAKLKVALGE